jgi:hypothetical protein
MSDDIEADSFGQQAYEAVLAIPPRMNAESRDQWYSAFLTFHAHFFPRAIFNSEYKAEFGKIWKALVSIREMRITDPDDYTFQMFEIMNRWAVACSKLYDDLGLKFRSERQHGLRHEVTEQ